MQITRNSIYLTAFAGFTTVDSVGFFSGAKQVLTFRPYVLLCTAFLFLSLAIAVMNISNILRGDYLKQN